MASLTLFEVALLFGPVGTKMRNFKKRKRRNEEKQPGCSEQPGCWLGNVDTRSRMWFNKPESATRFTQR